MNPADKAHVLFVDDEQRVLNSMRVMFKREYNLHLTTSGREAVELVKSSAIDVVISDQRMPEMEGVDLLEQIKIASPRTVRILLTGYADLDAIEGSINRGEVFRFLTKPCAPDELRSTIAQAVQIAREERSIAEQEAARTDSGEIMGTQQPEDDDSFTRTEQNLEVPIALSQVTGQRPPEHRAPEAAYATAFADTLPSLDRRRPGPDAAAVVTPAHTTPPARPAEQLPHTEPADTGTNIILEGESFTVVGADTPPRTSAAPVPARRPAANRAVKQDDVGVLVFTADDGLLETIRGALADRFHVVRASNIVHVTKLLRAVRPGVLLTDISEDPRVIERMVNALKQHLPELVTIVVGDHRDTVGLMNLINHGQIYRFLQKPLATGTCFMTVKAAAQKHKQLLANPQLARRHAVRQSGEADPAAGVMKSFMERLRSVPRRWTGT